MVETIAGLAAQEVEGVASMASVSTGLADMFTRKSTRNLTKGVRVDINGGTVAVDVTIVVEYGSPIPDVAKSIQENVKKAIETMSGLDVRNVDVHVQAVSFERENRAAQELKEHQQKLLTRTTTWMRRTTWSPSTPPTSAICPARARAKQQKKATKSARCDIAQARPRLSAWGGEPRPARPVERRPHEDEFLG